MGPRNIESEVSELAARASALRAAIARAQVELKAASAEEREISERLIELEAAATAPSPSPAPRATTTETPKTPKKSEEETVLTPGLHLSRRDAWKVALAGASAATLFAAIVLTVQHEIASSSPEPTPAATATVIPAIPAATIVAAAPPATTTTPVGTVLGVNSDPDPLPEPPRRPVRRLFADSPRPPPPPSPPQLPARNRADSVDDLLNAALDGTPVPAGTIGPPPPPTTTTAAPSSGTGIGALTVVCLPKCDRVIDNGTSLGAGHIFNRPLPSGRHTIALSAPNGTKKTLQVEITANQTRELRVSMEEPRNPNFRTNANCNPPFFIDDNGHRHYRAECIE